MFLVLDDLVRGCRELSRTLTPEVTGDDGRPLLDGPVLLMATVTVDSRVELHGRLTGRLRLACSRCLEPVEREIDLPVEVRLVGDAAESGAHDGAMRVEDASLVYAEQGRVDLTRLAGELVQLDLPLKALCRPECPGLCPTCGVDRNRIECGCRNEGVDPRLEPLRRLRRS